MNTGTYVLYMLIGAAMITVNVLLYRGQSPQELTQYFRQARSTLTSWVIGTGMLSLTLARFWSIDWAMNIWPLMMGFAFSRAYGNGWKNPRSKLQTVIAAIILLALGYLFSIFWPQTGKYWIWYLIVGIAFDALLRLARRFLFRSRSSSKGGQT